MASTEQLLRKKKAIKKKLVARKKKATRLGEKGEHNSSLGNFGGGLSMQILPQSASQKIHREWKRETRTRKKATGPPLQKGEHRLRIWNVRAGKK